MDLINGMKAFVATVETGSFTAAANRVGISNKLVSKYVAQLEARLGVRLLHRTTRTLSLSEAGQRYFSRCAVLIEELDELEDSVQNKDAELRGTLRISAPSNFGELYIISIVKRFRQNHPELIFDLRLSDHYADLAETGIDLAIRIGKLEDSSLISRRLSETELWAVASPAFLKKYGEPETPKDLIGFDCIRDTNQRAGQFWPFMIHGQLQKISVNGGFLVNSAVAVRDLALSDVGVGLCPDYVVSENVMSGQLQRILQDFSSLKLDIHAIFLSARHMPRKLRVFLEYLTDQFRGNAPWHDIRATKQTTDPDL